MGNVKYYLTIGLVAVVAIAIVSRISFVRNLVLPAQTVV